MTLLQVVNLDLTSISMNSGKGLLADKKSLTKLNILTIVSSKMVLNTEVIPKEADLKLTSLIKETMVIVISPANMQH